MLVVVACTGLPAAAAQAPSRTARPPALGAIREQDIHRDIDVLAGDAMRGREAGSLDELRAAAWLADHARKAGLAPAGDDGTYFQFWSIRRTVTAEAPTVSVGGDTLQIGRDFALQTPTSARIDAPIVYLDAPPAAGATPPDLAGKVVVVPLQLGVRGDDPGGPDRWLVWRMEPLPGHARVSRVLSGRGGRATAGQHA